MYNPLNKNLSEKIAEIIVNDIEMALQAIDSRGFILILALLCNLPLTILKIIDCACNHYARTYPTLGEVRKNELQDPKVIKLLTKEELNARIRTIESESIKHFEHPIFKPSESKVKIEALQSLRSYLLSTNYVLEATLIKKVSHSVNQEDIDYYLASGELKKPCWTEYITFSEKINNNLKEIFPHKIKLKKIKESNYPCIAFPNGDTFELIDDLKRVFLTDKIKIKFDTSIDENYNKERGIKIWN